MNVETSTELSGSWEFHKGDIGGIWESCRPAETGTPEDALSWERVDLPHCFNGTDSVDPDIDYYQGSGWYRKDIDPKNPFPHGRTLLHFEGSGQVSEVYIGTEKVAEHIGGYDEWSVDITDFLNEETGEPVRVSIHCTNARNLKIIPSDLSDFNLYGGLYRPAHLVYQPEVHVVSLKLVCRTAESLDKADVELIAELDRSDECRCLLEIQDPTGAPLIEEYLISKGAAFRYDVRLRQPILWSPDSPSLYSCKLTIPGEDGIPDQVYTETFGLRHFRFAKNGPFFLNGERLLLKGTHRHEDHAGVAAAMPANLIEKEMLMIKSMGANFIRLGHYQQSRQVLDLCDRLGILVWEEIPWCRGGLGGKDYQHMGRRMLENMILQHHNHPSVILWGLGNENDWPGDFPTFDQEKIRRYMMELHDLSHSLDGERVTAIRRCSFCRDIPDVYSPSIWAGWYRGHYREYKDSTLQHIKDVDHFLHVEWGASSHAGRFSEDPYLGLENLKTGVGTDERGSDASLYGGIARVSKDGSWSENYACDLFDWTLKEQETMPELTGTAFWPFKDFSTPLRSENPVPYVNQKGVVERDLTPKEAFYVVQSYWSVEPMIRIFGHGWTDRWGQEGECKELRVYSNCSVVELFLDGRSLGRKSRDSQDFPAAGLRWDAELQKGQHTLKAVAIEEGIDDSTAFTYHSDGWGPPHCLQESVTEAPDGSIRIDVQVVDEQGRLCLDYEDYVSFSLAGRGALIDNLGTSRGSRTVQCCNGKSGISVKDSKGTAVLGVECCGIDPLFINL